MYNMVELAIQGFKGSYHEIAAYKYFGEREELKIHECISFHELFKTMHETENVYGVVAIENTVAGTILPNYTHLLRSKFQIIGEVYLRIEHCLLGNESTNLANIQEVHSHPMALLQCLEFFDNYPHIKLIETADTALSAADLKQNNRKDIAVIASFHAAESLGLNILERGVESNSRNFTRFLIIHNKNTEPNFNKISLHFNLKHQTGALSMVLSKFFEHNINLTKIQSLPVIGSEWEYSFIVDIDCSSIKHFEAVMIDLETEISEVRVLGKYFAGRKYRKI